MSAQHLVGMEKIVKGNVSYVQNKDVFPCTHSMGFLELDSFLRGILNDLSADILINYFQ
jgi:hypothetical protein